MGAFGAKPAQLTGNYQTHIRDVEYWHNSATITGHSNSEYLSQNKRRKKRRSNLNNKQLAKQREVNEKFLRNVSSHQLIEQPGWRSNATDVTGIRQPLLLDYEHFASKVNVRG